MKRFEIKPPSFDGRGSVRTFLAKFNNLALHNRFTENEQLYYLTNCFENSAVQVLWDLQLYLQRLTKTPLGCLRECWPGRSISLTA